MTRKTFILDTNIILDSVDNLQHLSENGKNLIVIPATVIDELDSKKSGNNAINMEARKFNRFMASAEDIKNELIDDVAYITIFSIGNITIHVVDLIQYETDGMIIDYKIKNDRKIIETAIKVKPHYPNLKVLSNDVSFRLKAMTHLSCEGLKRNEKDISKFIFQDTINVQSLPYSALSIDEIKAKYNKEINPETSSIKFVDVTDRAIYYYREGVVFSPIDDQDTDIKKLKVEPRNIGQKILAKLMISDFNDVVITDSKSGSGKNMIALAAGIKCIMDYNDKYKKIVYTRKTIISGDKSDELGFEPGDLQTKMAGYMAPMEGSIEQCVIRQYKGNKEFDPDMLRQKVDAFKKKYPIEYLYQGHLRGTTITDAVVILDEVQNFTINDIKLILTRIGDNCKVFVLGSNKQIDNPYLNPRNNALTYLIGKSKENNGNIRVVASVLTKTVRSKIAEWADNFEIQRK